MTDGYPHALPEDETLAQAAMALEDGRLAGEVLDADWRLRYVSAELRNLLGFHRDEDLSYGVLALRRTTISPEVWRLPRKSQLEWWLRDGPYARHDLPGDEAWARRELGEMADLYLRTEGPAPPIAWAGAFDTTFADGGTTQVGRLIVRLNRPDGEFAGMLGIYSGGGQRGSVQAMLSRGDSRMFERMALLTEPARRPAAVMFCDLEGSGVLSRRLSSKAYFELIRGLTTAIDAAVIEHGGIVGKHAGDGASSFFLAEQCGGEAEACAGALRAAMAVQDASAASSGDAAEVKLNIGVHWGGTLVIGQVVTGGRLEVTALGDEVNEAARVQETARGGATLVSKDVVERLPAAAAAELGVDPDAVSYSILAEIEGVGEKARRDAGGLAVTTLPRKGGG
jgi:class 3 adenylate cyclase